MTTQTIPDVYTTYLDGQLGNVAPSLANIVAIVGAAKTGTPGVIRTFSGPSAKNDAKLEYHSGDLLEAITNEFDNGASEVRSVRAGSPVQAYITLKNTSAVDALTIKGKYSTLGNNDYVSVTRTEAYSVVTLTVEIQDRNTSPYTDYEYTASGAESAVLALLAAEIDAGGVYSTTTLVSTLSLVTATATAMANGTDGTPLTNGDYTTALAATESETDVSWIRASGATTAAQWALVLTHCATMYTSYAAERWALLEAPLFTTSYDEGTAGYNTDRQTYVDAVIALAANVADKNAVIVCGGVSILNVDGTAATRTAADVVSGRVASLRVSQSMINKTVSGVLALVPEFTPGQMASLIAAKVNFLRNKPANGYTIGHSLTCCPTGSDYDRMEFVRTVYYAAKQVRTAVSDLVGEAGDAEGTALRKIEEEGKVPLKQMKDSNPPDLSAFTLTAEYNDPTTRRNPKIRMGLQPLSTNEILDHDVFLYS